MHFLAAPLGHALVVLAWAIGASFLVGDEILPWIWRDALAQWTLVVPLYLLAMFAGAWMHGKNATDKPWKVCLRLGAWVGVVTLLYHYWISDPGRFEFSSSLSQYKGARLSLEYSSFWWQRFGFLALLAILAGILAFNKIDKPTDSENAATSGES